MIALGVDEQPAQHVAHLFIRDPVGSLCLEDLHQNDEETSSLFEARFDTNITENTKKLWSIDFDSN